MKVAFVLPGGAALGACQVGMLQALHDAGVAPDLLVGTSVGAINAAYVGLHSWPGALDGMARLWASFRRRDLVRLRPAQAVLALAGRNRALFDRSGMASFLARELGDARLEDMSPPVAVVATDALGGEPVLLTRGPVVQAVMASSAMPGVFAPVRWDGKWLMDGSVAADAGVAQAHYLRAEEIWVLTTSSLPTHLPRAALDLAVHAFALAAGTGTAAQVASLGEGATVRILPPPVTDGPGVFDFRRGAELIAEARRRTAAWLDSGATAPRREQEG